MSEQPSGGRSNNDDGSENIVRTQTFDTDGPVELDLDITAGTVEVRLDGDSEEKGTSVEVRSAPAASPEWAHSAAEVLNRVSEIFGGQVGSPFAGVPADAVREVRIEQIGERIVVRGSKIPPPMNSALAVTVHAPAGSHVRVRTRLAAVAVRGTCGRADISTGSGTVTLDRVAESTTVRTGSGEVDIAALDGPVTVNGGSGDVRFGEVTDTTLARTAGGEIVVDDAASGSVEAFSGSGDIRIGIRKGTTAEVDLSSGGGSVHSALEVADSPPDEEVALSIRARSGSGNVLVTGA
ncbi:DUF4097 family beta strand repeat-containing protein [Saccharomonospora sp.]|uniref:DUF4097 family beta strand repeat-containing protein n=1 Tax=Saccharomonospora sp. TaxID=33913 RepID=UPI00261C8EA1|nr:DUF4097 family beta strand repeat-containing protein [Saccharomonospora sp.]